MDPEFLKALDLVAEYDKHRPKLTKECRIYYNDDGSIIGMWETEFPTGNYIVIDHPDKFYNVNTLQLRVVDKVLTKIDMLAPFKSRLGKSTAGQSVVKGHAAIAIDLTEFYEDIEYYDKR